MKRPALLLLLALPASAALGQSLADLAEQAKKKRRKDTPVYTDDDLKRRSPGPAASPASGVGSGDEGGAPAAGNEGGGSGGAGYEGRRRGSEGGGSASDEDSVRAERATRLAAIKEAEGRIAAAQERLNALNSDLNPTNLSDPFRMQTIEAEKAKAKQEIEEAKLALEQARDELEDFDEDARKRGVPPGWLREP